eukprot:gnl/Chilomastix_caulleri/3395.p3 GENE.gnl/Chilomastix_caulleri/3395~~gnl/Chilomastix_caulleri/3395.p3  ORF type:complete len:53 (+),score=4.99 gnl/Chilomastix_caulleri/3395:211-369(+)
MSGQLQTTAGSKKEARCGINDSYLIFAGNVIEPKYVPIIYGDPKTWCRSGRS